jgi:hypothetical protein
MPKPSVPQSTRRDQIGSLTRADFDAAVRDAIALVGRDPFEPSTNIYKMRPVPILVRPCSTR